MKLRKFLPPLNIVLILREANNFCAYRLELMSTKWNVKVEVLFIGDKKSVYTLTKCLGQLVANIFYLKIQ